MENLKKVNCNDILTILKYLIALVISLPAKLFVPKNMWLISERGDEARDNAYHLFKYIRTMHLNKNCYFLIKKNCKDYEKVRQYGNIIEYGSIKHFVYYILSKVCISTHIYRYIPDDRVVSRLDKLFHLKKIRVFLQHGVIKDSHPYLASDIIDLDLFCCSAQRECDFIKKSLRYTDDVAICTGLARYDNLLNYEEKDYILLMPTWRGDLYQLSDDEFVKSDYYLAFQKILTSKKLKKVLDEENMKLIFYPHYEMQKFIHLFKSNCNNILIAEHEKFDVQQLLKESKLLITDYSSVFFDFAYMKKPLLYYQFDKDIYFKRHYAKGYFDYERDGFGEIVMEENVVSSIIKYLYDLTMPEKYIHRVDSFFRYRDQKNCERIFNEIEKKCVKNGRVKK